MTESPRRGRWTASVLALVSYVGAALAFNWPLPAHLASAFTGPVTGDTGIYIWNLWVFRHEIVEHGRFPLFTSEIMALAPRVDLSLHNYTIFSNILAFPLIPILGVPATFNVVYLGIAALTAWTMFLLARRVVGRTAEAWLAGLLFGFSPVLVARSTAHFSLAAAAPLPVFVLCLIRAEERWTWKNAAALGATVAWASMCDRLLRRVLRAHRRGVPRGAPRAGGAARGRGGPSRARDPGRRLPDAHDARRDHRDHHDRPRPLPAARPGCAPRHALQPDVRPDRPRDDPARADLPPEAARDAAGRAAHHPEPRCRDRGVRAADVATAVCTRVAARRRRNPPPPGLLAQQPARRGPPRPLHAEPEPRALRHAVARVVDHARGRLRRERGRAHARRGRRRGGGGLARRVPPATRVGRADRGLRRAGPGPVSLRRRREHLPARALGAAPLRPGRLGGPHARAVRDRADDGVLDRLRPRARPPRRSPARPAAPAAPRRRPGARLRAGPGAPPGDRRAHPGDLPRDRR